MAYSFRPANANTLSVTLGVTHELSNCIINNETISETVETLEVHDQAYRIAQIFAYDKSYNTSLEVVAPIGQPPVNVGDIVSWYNVKNEVLSGMVTQVDFIATYNDTAKYNISIRSGMMATYHDKTNDAL